MCGTVAGFTASGYSLTEIVPEHVKRLNVWLNALNIQNNFLPEKCCGTIDCLAILLNILNADTSFKEWSTFAGSECVLVYQNNSVYVLFKSLSEIWNQQNDIALALTIINTPL